MCPITFRFSKKKSQKQSSLLVTIQSTYSDGYMGVNVNVSKFLLPPARAPDQRWATMTPSEILLVTTTSTLAYRRVFVLNYYSIVFFTNTQVVVRMMNSLNYYCSHQNFCHPFCYRRHMRACSRLTKALRKVSTIYCLDLGTCTINFRIINGSIWRQTYDFWRRQQGLKRKDNPAARRAAKMSKRVNIFQFQFFERCLAGERGGGWWWWMGG